MTDKENKKCSNCGNEIGDTYFTCLDNFIQVKYFDKDEDNIFCSQECFCKSLMLYEMGEKLVEYFIASDSPSTLPKQLLVSVNELKARNKRMEELGWK